MIRPATGAETTTPHGRLLMIAVLGGLADFERDLIPARTSEGLARAKARGVKLGREPKLTDFKRREALARRDAGRETLAELGRSYGVAQLTWQPDLLRFADGAKQRNIHTPSANQVRRPHSSGAIGQWRDYADQMAQVESLIASGVRDFCYETT